MGAESGATPRAASTSPRVDVSVVVVTYNALPWIESCLASIEGYDTVVVDHGSTDGTVDEVRTRFPDVRIVTQENLGLGAGWNRGIRETSGSYVLILNADAWALDDAVDRLAAFADAHPRCGVAGPQMLDPDGTWQPSRRRFPTVMGTLVRRTPLRRAFPPLERQRDHYLLDERPAEPVETDWMLGGFLLLRRTMLDEIGGYDSGFRMYGEDIDLCYRAARAGWARWYVPGAVVRHRWDRLTDRRMLTRRTLWHWRGMLRFVRKHPERLRAL